MSDRNPSASGRDDQMTRFAHVVFARRSEATRHANMTPASAWSVLIGNGRKGHEGRSERTPHAYFSRDMRKR
eukprot:7381998-Prymnesium_polylepis.1